MAENTQVDFTPQDQQSDLISFDPVDTTPTVSTSVASMRAAKATMGLQPKIPIYTDDLRAIIQKGHEDNARADIASQLDQQRLNRQQALVSQKVQEQGFITPEQVRDIPNQMFKDDLFDGKIDPKSVFENHFASEYINNLHWPVGEDGPHWWKDALQQIPQPIIEQVQQGAVDYVKEREYMQKRLEDIQAKIQERTPTQSVGAFALGLIPFREQYLQRGNIPYPGFAASAGEALEQQRQSLVTAPDWQTFQSTFDRTTDAMEAHDLDSAAAWVQGMLGQSFEQRLQHNVGQLLDISMIPGPSSLVKKAVLYNSVKSAYSDAAKSSAKIGTQTVEAAAADGTGNLEKAAIINTADEMKDLVQGTAKPEVAAYNALSSVLKQSADAVKDTPGRSGQELANRIYESMDSFRDNLLSTITNSIKVERMSAVLASRKAVAAIVQKIRDDYVRLDNHIINQSAIYWDPLTSEYRSDLNFGQFDATYFTSPGQAQVWAAQKGVQGGRILKNDAGVGYYYSYPVTVKETNTAWLRDSIETANTEIPDSMLQAYTGWLGWARTPEETLSAVDNWNRKAVIYGQAQLKNLFKEKAENLNKLYYGPGNINRFTPAGRKRTEEFMRTIEAAPDQFDPDIESPSLEDKGYWFKNPQELEHFYQTNFQRLPDELETKAYFDVSQMHDLDWVVRNNQLHKAMSIRGVKEYRVTAFKTPGGHKNYSDFIPAIKVDRLPNDDSIIARMGDNVGEERVGPANKISQKDRADVEEKLQNGQMQLIQFWDANHLPLKDFGGNIKAEDHIQYVLGDGKTFREQPLSFNQLPRRGGGHVDYDFARSIKQARMIPQRSGKAGQIYKDVYLGDTTIALANMPEVAGKNFVKMLEEAREHLKAGRLAESEAAIGKTPIPWKDFQGWFKPSAYVDKEGKTVKVPPRASLREPFAIVPKDRMIIDMPESKLVERYTNSKTGKSTFVDGTKEGSPARQFFLQYGQARDAYELMSVTDKGTRYNPLYGYGPANRIDPLTSLNRGLNRIIHSFYMDDYKSTAINNWLQQAYGMGAFDANKASLNQIKAAPLHFFQRANEYYKRGFDKGSGDYHKLEIARMQTKAFVGEFSPIDAWINNVQTKLENTIYGGGLGKAAIVPYYGIPAIRNAGRYLRSAVFHTTIGTFNWVQYLVQNMTYSTILGIAGPTSAYHGWLGATLHNIGRFAGWANHDVGVMLDKMASRMGGWKPGEWLEAREALAHTGFGFVGQEHVMMDYMLHPKVIQGNFGKFLDAGQFFFKAGERHARFGAWFTAFKEFRDANPTKALTNLDKLQILNRADLLAGNMTTASKSLLQKGPFEFTTQFLGYSLRLAEQMTGKRLTRVEKARLFAVNGAMYGIPAALGIVGLPLTDWFRQGAQTQTDYVIGEHWYQDVLMNGLPAFIGALISGEGDPSAGTYYNVGDRFGNPGTDIFRDAWFGDKPLLRIMMGAAGSTALDGMYQMSGFLNVARSFIKDGNESFPYSFDDIMDAARILYSVNHAYGGYLAWSTGEIRSKKNTPIEATSPNNAIWETLTGLSSQQASDFTRFKYNIDTEKQLHKDAESLATRELQRARQSGIDNDFTEANKHFARAKAYLDAAKYPVSERERLYASALDNKDLNFKMNWNYYMVNPPQGEERSRIETFFRQQQIQGRRNPQ